jgi:hypothetical protein
MKKILRLVTTSVLTLTLVACGEASSSVSNGTTTSSSVSSTTSAYANVTTITLSAATDVLTQTMGTQKAVVVQAALNANTNPSLAIEWLVNGTKSNQTGRVFEYTPAAAGTFVITARVGSVVSNALTLNVGAAELVISDLKVVDNNTLEITAPGGATVAVTSNEVLPASYYDITKGIYVIELKTALAQGGSTTVTLTRDGLAPVSRVATFDTRVIDVAAITGAKDNKDGTWDITRPHELNPSTLVTNTVTDQYLVQFQGTNLGGSQLAFKLEQVSVPAGATPLATSEGLVNVATAAKSNANSFTFNVTRATLPGAYVFRYTLSGVSRLVTLNVLSTEAEIELADIKNASVGVRLGTLTDVSGSASDLKIFEAEADIGTAAKASTATFNLVYRPGTQAGLVGVKANTDGSYDIVKDYLPTATAFKELYFKLDGDFFSVPSNLLTQSTVLPNQAQISLVGPENTPIMRTQYVTQTALPTLSSGFRVAFDLGAVRQKIDASTPVGKYTYTVRVLQLGVEVFKKDVVINVVNFSQTQLLSATLNDQSTAFTAAIATSFAPRLTRIDSLFPTETDAGAANFAATTGYGIAKTALLRHFLGDLPTPTAISGFNYTTYLAARTAWVNDVTNTTDGELKFAGGATSAQLSAASPDYGALVTTPTDNQLKAVLDVFGAYNVDPAVNSGATSGTVVVTTALVDNTQAKYKLVFDATIVSAKAFLNIAPAITSIDTLDEYNAELAKFKANVAKLYPTYEEIVNAGTATFKAGADGVFEIARPYATGLDSKSAVFNLTLTNFEGANNPAADIANSYLVGGVKKELVNYVRSITGPALLPNQTLNTSSTKLAIELNSSGSANALTDTVSTQEQPTAKTYTRYRAASHASAQTSANKVTIPNVGIVDVDFLTPVGEYTINVQVGTFNQLIKVRVVNPTPKVNFGLVSTNATLGLFDSFTYNATEDKYYATLGRNPDVNADTSDDADFKLQLTTENIVVPTSGDNNGKLAYSFTKTTPTVTETRSDLVAMTVVDGNDGKFELTNKETGIASLELREDEKQIIDVAGTYIFDLTLGGVRKVVTLVVQEYPNLKDVKVNVGTTAAQTFGSRFLLADTAKAISISAAGVNLPSSELFYSVSLGASSATDGIDVELIEDESMETNGTIIPPSTKVYKPLDVSKAISVQLITDGAATSEVGLATNASIINKVRFLQLTIYRRTKDASFNPLIPTYDLTRIGHETIELWYAPTNSPVQVITSGTADRTSATEATVAVTSDTAGSVYWMLMGDTATAPTVLQLVTQTSITGMVTSGNGISALSSLAATLTMPTLTTGTDYKLYYIVVSGDTISSITVVEVPAE